ncbi:RHS repeat domain-containing protein [Actinoplanes subtropicus]|uniref:RHS repeat domain-containing protein n=1 Tax=Actinoplanes subtropicus TaxID=543632 RepID=UPI000691B05D|nr:RHS repeat-associated core domain-containing protein [Actinoplanes subtropicus]
MLSKNRLAAAALAALLVPSVMSVTPAQAAPKDKGFSDPAPLKRVALTGGRTKRAAPPRKSYPKFDPAGHAALPGAQDATVRLTAKTAARVGDSPISLARAAGGASPDAVHVTTLSQQAARTAGVHGVLFSLRGSGGGDVSVTVDDSRFRNAYGGGFASRLHLVRLPSCVLSSPQLPQCQRQTPVSTQATAPLSARVALAADNSTTVLAATSGGSGSGGSYSATSLAPGGSWSTGGNTGSFTYSYPIAVPPAIGGGAPTLDLGYDSATQDARTEGTNDQSSWLGDGWDVADSFIERTYQACDDVKDSGEPAGGGDTCWAGQLLTMSLNGASTSIVYDDDTKTFHSSADTSTTKIEKLSGATNGTANGEYFRVTENGVQYYFGLNRLPGWSTGAAETGSAWTVPVYRAHAGVGDCPDGAFAATACTLGYRFNLDYVVDTHGNATAYYYSPETGYYGADDKNDAVAYTRGGTLDHIDYGMTASTVYSAAPEQIKFDVTERCTVGEPAGNTCTDAQFTSGHPEYWPDVPVDMNCTKGADCTNHGPTFWSRRALASITTQVRVGGAYQQVDRYDFTHSFPDNGDSAPTLWLESIKHTGLDRLGGAAADASTPAVVFYPGQLPNRVGTVPGLPRMYHNRITTVVSETGAETDVVYRTPDCGDLPASDLTDASDAKAQAYASDNKTACFPVYWIPEAQPRPLIDWFYTHPVASVTTLDPNNHYQDGSSPHLITEYAYQGTPGWHYDDNETVKAKNRTWGQFRGYPEVDIRTGDPAVFHYTDGTQVFDRRTLTKNYYFLGMDGDTLPNGQKRPNHPLTSTDGTITADDSGVLAGQLFESVTYTGDGGTINSSTVTVPTIIGPTASRARTGLPALTAQMVRTARTVTRQAVSTGWRRTETDTFYNRTLGQSTTGMPVQTADLGESGAAGNAAHCTFHRYLDGKTATLVEPAEVITTDQKCDTAGAQPSGTLLSDLRTSYDGNAFAYNNDGQSNPALPTVGNATLDQQASAASGTTASAFVDLTRKTYDGYGRVVSTIRTPSSTTPDGKASIAQSTYTRLTPSSGALPGAAVQITQVTAGVDCSAVTTSSKDCQLSSTTLDAARQKPIAETSVSGGLTSMTYDALGRLTAVWLPNKSMAAKAPANMTYTYAPSNTGPSIVTTSTLRDDGGYNVSKALSDAMLRELEKQAVGENGSTAVTDTQYDSHGWTVLINNAYAVSGDPRDALISDHLSQVSIPSTTATDHDAMGRVTQSTDEHNGAAIRYTRTAYTGDTTTVLPPAGGVATTTTVNGRGQTVGLAQYTSPPTMSGTLSAGFTASGGARQTIAYTYTADGKQSTVTGPDGSVWGYGYDLLGRQTSHTDPDSGTSYTGYDDAGRVTATKDARGVELDYTYDLLGRKLTAVDKAKSNFQFASWTYDTLKIGKPTSSTRYVSGVTGGYTVAVTGYSALGNPMGSTVTLPSVERPLPSSYSTGYAYTGTTEALAQQSDPAAGNLPGETITYTHDALGAATRTSGVDLYVADTTYTDFAQLSKVLMGDSADQAAVLYTYDEETLRLTGREIQRSQGIGPTVDDTTYSYDPAGNPLAVTDKQSETGNTVTDVQCYRYNGLARLAEAWTAADSCPAAGTGPAATAVSSGPGSYWQSYGYDSVGDRTSLTDHSTAGGTDVSASYTNGCSSGCNRTGAQPHTLTATTGGADPAKFVYDVAGNLLTRTATSGNGQNLKWDDEGHLAQVDTTGSTPTTTKYLYDADGNQLIRRDPGRTTLFAGDTQVVINTAVSPAVVLGAVRTYQHGGTGAAVAERSTLPGGGTDYLFNDARGTANLAMDTTTQALSRQQYKPYGQVRASSNTTAWPDLTHGYLGVPQDLGTGYADTGARKYDPALGRFISPDPVLETTDPNQLGGYTYAGDNPISHSDPSGLCDPDICAPQLDHTGSGSGGDDEHTTKNGKKVPVVNAGSTGHAPLTMSGHTYVDQNGIPHVTMQAPGKNAGVVAFLNQQLTASGEYYDPSTGNGSMYLEQNEDNPAMGKGLVRLGDGKLVPRGTTADSIKVSWVNGRMVSVDSVDFTATDTAYSDARGAANANTMKNKMDVNGKGQAGSAVYVAKSDAEAADMYERVKDVPNARVVNPTTGWDSGEVYSDTHLAALRGLGLKETPPRTATGEVEGGGGGRAAGAAGALSLVGDLYQAYKFGHALGSKDPREMDSFMCGFTGLPVYCAQANGVGAAVA